jgi:hypothetical protein
MRCGLSVTAFSIAMTLRGPVAETPFSDFQNFFWDGGVKGSRSQILEVGLRLKGMVLAGEDGTRERRW